MGSQPIKFSTGDSIEIDYNNLELRIKYKEHEISYLPCPFFATDLHIGEVDFLLN